MFERNIILLKDHSIIIECLFLEKINLCINSNVTKAKEPIKKVVSLNTKGNGSSPAA